jgi:hypothetical protein
MEQKTVNTLYYIVCLQYFSHWSTSQKIMRYYSIDYSKGSSLVNMHSEVTSSYIKVHKSCIL